MELFVLICAQGDLFWFFIYDALFARKIEPTRLDSTSNGFLSFLFATTEHQRKEARRIIVVPNTLFHQQFFHVHSHSLQKSEPYFVNNGKNRTAQASCRCSRREEDQRSVENTKRLSQGKSRSHKKKTGKAWPVSAIDFTFPIQRCLQEVFEKDEVYVSRREHTWWYQRTDNSYNPHQFFLRFALHPYWF